MSKRLLMGSGDIIPQSHGIGGQWTQMHTRRSSVLSRRRLLLPPITLKNKAANEGDWEVLLRLNCLFLGGGVVFAIGFLCVALEAVLELIL